MSPKILRLLLGLLILVGSSSAAGISYLCEQGPIYSPNMALCFGVLAAVVLIGGCVLVFDVELERKADPLSAAEHTAALSVITEYQRPWADPGSKIATLSGRARKGFGGHS